jgi:hypothetical protein
MKKVKVVPTKRKKKEKKKTQIKTHTYNTEVTHRWVGRKVGRKY